MLPAVVASLVRQHQNISDLIFVQIKKNKTNVITDIAASHMGPNGIINSEVNQDLVADSIIVLILV